MLLRKQTAFAGVWNTELEFEPSRQGEEAGTIVWRNEYAFGAVSIRGVAANKDGGLAKAIVYRYFDMDSDDEKEIIVPLTSSEPLRLQIVASEDGYAFYYALRSSTEFTHIGSMNANLFWRERRGPPFDAVLDSPFTGTHFGVFCEGPLSEPCMAAAYYSYASWHGRRQGGI